MPSITAKLDCSTLKSYCPWWAQCVSCTSDKITISNDWVWGAGSTAEVSTYQVYIKGYITTIDIYTEVTGGNEFAGDIRVTLITASGGVLFDYTLPGGASGNTLKLNVSKYVDSYVFVKYSLNERAAYAVPVRTYYAPIINYETSPPTPPTTPTPTPTPTPTTPTPTTPTYTNELRVYFVKLPWASEESLKSAMPVITGAVNPIIEALGYKFVTYSINWNDSYFSLYYSKLGTPAVPLTLVIVAIVGALFSIGLILYSIAWLESSKVQEQYIRSQTDLYQDVLNLVNEGKLTPEQAQAILNQLQLKTQQPCKLLGLVDLPLPQDLCGIAQLMALGGVFIGGLYVLRFISDLFRE
jgi:hypothetical protein